MEIIKALEEILKLWDDCNLSDKIECFNDATKGFTKELAFLNVEGKTIYSDENLLKQDGEYILEKFIKDVLEWKQNKAKFIKE